MDNNLDQMLNTLLTFFTYKVPMFLAPYFLYSYAVSQKYFEKAKNQLYITSSAIQNSFREEFLGFIKTSNDSYFPFVMTSATKSTCDPRWIYNSAKNIFTFGEIGAHQGNHNLPFIGASVAYGNQTIGDLSDWMMDQKVHGPDAAIPLQVLVGAWRYYYDNTLMFSFKDYTFTAITDDGEEHIYNLENEEEIITDTHSTPSATDECEDTRHTVTPEEDVKPEDEIESKKSN